MAWKKAFEAQKPYGPKSTYAAKKKKKKKKKDEAKEKRKTQEPVVPKLKLKKKSAPSVVSSNNDPLVSDRQYSEVKSSEKGGEASSVGSNPLAATQTEEDLEIRSSLYTHDTVEDFIPPGKPFPYRPLQRYTTNIKNYMAEKYLDSLYLDKIFLETLKTAKGVGSPNVEGTKKIIQMCKNGFKALSYKQVGVLKKQTEDTISFKRFYFRNYCVLEDHFTLSNTKKPPQQVL